MQRELSGSEAPDYLHPTHTSKTLRAIKAPHAVKRITFDKSEANPGETLYVRVPKLNENEVLVPGSLALRFEIDLTGGHANNYLVQKVSRALVSKMVVKFAGTILQDTDGYDLFKIYEDLFLSQEQRVDMVLDGIQSEDLCKIRSNAGDKKTSGVDAENKLTENFGTKYYIRLDHEILTGHGVFYPQALYNDLVFELTLAGAAQVVKGSDPTKLKYKLTNIQLEYEMIHSPQLAQEANSTYSSGKAFAYEHVHLEETIPFQMGSDTRLNIKVNAQRRSLKAILLLFTEPYTAGTRDSEKYVFPDLKKVKVTINGSPNMLYNEGIVSTDLWKEAKRFFVREKNKTEHMNLKLFLAGDRFGLLVDLRSMADRSMHGSGVRLVNTTDGVQLEIERKASGSGVINCQVFLISDAQFNILGNQLNDVQY